ncbi:hypothetical protein [Scytonema hofmannii]|uniref:hypothetical protein n=1 Tax=Scytonema hofmannii TaxID=34078 RepID=UPI0011E02435|nr:hypothetical protein [Scytonema hofmannii]
MRYLYHRHQSRGHDSTHSYLLKETLHEQVRTPVQSLCSATQNLIFAPLCEVTKMQFIYLKIAVSKVASMRSQQCKYAKSQLHHIL